MSQGRPTTEPPPEVFPEENGSLANLKPDVSEEGANPLKNKGLRNVLIINTIISFLVLLVVFAIQPEVPDITDTVPIQKVVEELQDDYTGFKLKTQTRFTDVFQTMTHIQDQQLKIRSEMTDISKIAGQLEKSAIKIENVADLLAKGTEIAVPKRDAKSTTPKTSVVPEVEKMKRPVPDPDIEPKPEPEEEEGPPGKPSRKWYKLWLGR